MIEEKTYFRPDDLKTALALLQRPDIHAVPLAGGSWLVPHLRTDVDLPGSLADEVDAVVDLADLGLNAMRLEGSPGSGWLHLGATTLLADLVDGEACQAIAGGLLAEAARRKDRSTCGTPPRSPDRCSQENRLPSCCWPCWRWPRTIVVSGDGDERAVPLAQLLADPPAVLGKGLITELRLPWPNEGVRGGLARVPRTRPTTRSWPPPPWSTEAACASPSAV